MEEFLSSTWSLLAEVFIEGAEVLILAMSVVILWVLAGIGEHLRTLVEENRALREELSKGFTSLEMALHSEMRDFSMVQRDRLRR